MIKLHSIYPAARAECRVSNRRGSVTGYANYSATGQPVALHIGGLLWVKSVGSTRPTTSRHVRCASDSDRIGTLQRFDEECQKQTYAVQQKLPHFNQGC